MAEKRQEFAGAVGQQRRDAFGDLAGNFPLTIPLAQVQVGAQNIQEGPVADRLADRHTSALEPQGPQVSAVRGWVSGSFPLVWEPTPEALLQLGNQAGFSDPGLANNRDHLPLSRQPLVTGRLQFRQLALPANHPCP